MFERTFYAGFKFAGLLELAHLPCADTKLICDEGGSFSGGYHLSDFSTGFEGGGGFEEEGFLGGLEAAVGGAELLGSSCACGDELAKSGGGDDVGAVAAEDVAGARWKGWCATG